MAETGDAAGAGTDADEDTVLASALFELSRDWRDAFDDESRAVLDLMLEARSDRARGAGTVRLGNDAFRAGDGAEAVATERTWLACDRASARVTADEQVDVGSLIVA